MGINSFFSGNNGGFMDVIHCDEQEYLVHKWSPNGEANTTSKENAIRYGSRLRVRPSESALFVYSQDNGTMLDVIEGPVDETIKTANFPILTNIVGAAYGGESTFMAEIYFFNRQRNIQIKFGIPYFDVFDNRFPDLGIPCAVRGTLTFNITDIANFIKLYRLNDFDLSEFEDVIKDFFTRKIKATILNIPTETGIQVMQLERRLDEINEHIQARLTTELETDFGVNLLRLDIGAVELDKTSPFYLQLKGATADQQARFINSKTDIEITNMGEMARIQRKDIEMGVEGRNFTVHQVDLQADILKTAAENLGTMGTINGSGFNPLGIMTGMAMGGVMGNQMGTMMSNINNTPPPPPVTLYHIAFNGQQSGPFTIEQLETFAANGQFTKLHYFWKPGMTGWEPAENNAAFTALFSQSVPPPPPPPSAAAPEAKPSSSIDLTKKS
jgi:membrane protease subunit (stomatin/prohibitin family)